jgi:NAD(P)-dependent dehydrogenase (short-subunit alcohol dehydrogenase family)
LARSEGELEEVAREVRSRGGTAVVQTIDLTQPAEIGPAVAAAIAGLGGGLDVLINNAGLFDMHPLETMGLEFWQRMLDVNLTAPMLVSQACLEALGRGIDPVIINVASVAAESGFPGNAAYCASKYGLRGLGEAMRCDLEPRGIAVRCVYPRATDTSIFDEVAGDWNRATMDRPEDVAARILEATRPGAPDDLRME